MTCWPAGVLVSAAGMTTVSDVPPRCHAGPDGVLTPATPGTAFSDLTAPPGSAPPGVITSMGVSTPVGIPDRCSATRPRYAGPPCASDAGSPGGPSRSTAGFVGAGAACAASRPGDRLSQAASAAG